MAGPGSAHDSTAFFEHVLPAPSCTGRSPTHLFSMISWPFPKLLGNKNERELGRLRPIVSRIREIEGALQREPFEKLPELTRGWQDHLSRFHALVAPPK
jgi:hypothetical protein